MERSTVLFRDPSNQGRRFIPLLLADCELPETLRRQTSKILWGRWKEYLRKFNMVAHFYNTSLSYGQFFNTARI